MGRAISRSSADSKSCNSADHEILRHRTVQILRHELGTARFLLINILDGVQMLSSLFTLIPLTEKFVDFIAVRLFQKNTFLKTQFGLVAVLRARKN